MNLDRDAVKTRIRAKVIELAGRLGVDATGFTDDEIIPATGLLDSAAVLELVVWYEAEYDLPMTQEDVNIDNLGSVNAMTDFLIARKAVRPIKPS